MNIDEILRVKGNAIQLENDQWIFTGSLSIDGKEKVILQPFKLFNSEEECLQKAREEIEELMKVLIPDDIKDKLELIDEGIANGKN